MERTPKFKALVAERESRKLQEAKEELEIEETVKARRKEIENICSIYEQKINNRYAAHIEKVSQQNSREKEEIMQMYEKAKEELEAKCNARLAIIPENILESHKELQHQKEKAILKVDEYEKARKDKFKASWEEANAKDGAKLLDIYTATERVRPTTPAIPNNFCPFHSRSPFIRQMSSFGGQINTSHRNYHAGRIEKINVSGFSKHTSTPTMTRKEKSSYRSYHRMDKRHMPEQCIINCYEFFYFHREPRNGMLHESRGCIFNISIRSN
ncbi:hypothetical protein B0J14DRAFT_648788 [Halenospora varia]|nr:hypothetical protein B0J14DRAFT_648788 [Halenospora varia]